MRQERLLRSLVDLGAAYWWHQKSAVQSWERPRATRKSTVDENSSNLPRWTFLAFLHNWRPKVKLVCLLGCKKSWNCGCLFEWKRNWIWVNAFLYFSSKVCKRLQNKGAHWKINRKNAKVLWTSFWWFFLL